MNPADRKYTKTHEWIKIDGKTAIVGITDHAQKAMGDITFIELPAIGKVVKQTQECGVIESVKAASDIYAPVAGKIAEVNSALLQKPETVNKDPYGNGWILKISDVNGAELGSLMDATAYENSLGN